MNKYIISPEEYPYKHICNGNSIFKIDDTQYILNCSICGFMRASLRVQAPILGVEINIKIDPIKEYPQPMEYEDKEKLK